MLASCMMTNSFLSSYSDIASLHDDSNDNINSLRKRLEQANKPQISNIK